MTLGHTSYAWREMHVHVFYGDFLLAFAAMAIERFEQHGVGAGQLVGLIEFLMSALESLLGEHTASIGFHRSIVASDDYGRMSAVSGCRLFLGHNPTSM